jgi:predicted molibdopterin-dependent oxidoreductase YjgC
MNALRIKNHSRGTQVTIRVNGRPVAAHCGETLFAALLAAGIRTLRHSIKDSTKTARGAFCGMGVCQECRVTVDGMPDRRACMTAVREGMEVFTDGR